MCAFVKNIPDNPRDHDLLETVSEVNKIWIIFSYISERNNDYSDPLDLRRGWVGVVTFFVLEVLDYKFAILIPLYTIYICIRSYDTGRTFEPIFMKFTWLVRVHSWVSPIVFGNNWPDRTIDMGENVPQNQFFGFKSDSLGVFEKKI